MMEEKDEGKNLPITDKLQELGILGICYDNKEIDILYERVDGNQNRIWLPVLKYGSDTINQLDVAVNGSMSLEAFTHLKWYLELKLLPIWDQTYISKSKEDNGEPNRKRASFVEDATDDIMAKYAFLTIEESEEVVYYKNGVYVSGGEILIGKELESEYGFQLDTAKLAQVVGHVKRRTYHKREELDADINIINLKNGLYNIDKNELNPHDPKYLSIIQIPVVYDKKAKPKRFGSFLREVFYARDIRTAVEAMAYTFHRDYIVEIMFMLHGFGQNGKSVYTSILTALHGAQNVSNVPFSDMMGDRFAISDLEGKACNIDNELARDTIKETAVLKRLTGGSRQPVRIQRKNQQAYDTTLNAKLFFNANKIPETQDDSDAYTRRLAILSFPNRFEKGLEDRRLTAKLTSQQELSGIFNALMIVLRRIRRSQDVHLNERTIEEKREKYQRARNPIKAFLQDTLDEQSTEDSIISKLDLHIIYIIYCGKYGLPTEKYDSFCKLVKKNDMDSDGTGIQIGDVRKDLGEKTPQGKPRLTHCWTGINLTGEYARLLLKAKGGEQTTLDDQS
jgi:putative DNA primase/helicase